MNRMVVNYQVRFLEDREPAKASFYPIYLVNSTPPVEIKYSDLIYGSLNIFLFLTIESNFAIIKLLLSKETGVLVFKRYPSGETINGKSVPVLKYNIVRPPGSIPSG